MIGLRSRSIAIISPAWSRLAHTRLKKVDVQLLKESYGRRFKGEIFQVSEGHMRLKLHPEGIAAYVLKNQPPPLPVLSQAEAQQMRRDAQIRLKEAEKVAKETQQQSLTIEQQEQPKVQSLIDALDFPSAKQHETKMSTENSVDSSEQPHKKFEWQSDLAANVAEENKR